MIFALLEDQPQVFPLDHTVGDRRQADRPLQQGAVATGRWRDQHRAPGHSLGKIFRCAAEQQFPFVKQQHFAALFGFVQIRGAPQDQHAVVGQFMHHAP
ncbi:hypothetical protein D3C78_1371630 [compost metagenome]